MLVFAACHECTLGLMGYADELAPHVAAAMDTHGRVCEVSHHEDIAADTDERYCEVCERRFGYYGTGSYEGYLLESV